MSTNDVPGAVSANCDELGMGCWAEHEDSSLLFVESTENGRVIYSVFDMGSDDVVEYRDSMKEKDFKKHFSWNPKAKKKDLDAIKWTWHDKTPFPWDRVIADGARDGVRHPHADNLLSAAEKVASSRKLKGVALDPKDRDHLVDKITGKVSKAIRKGIQKAINRLDI